LIKPKIIDIPSLNEKYFEYTHQSGLKIVVYPTKNYATFNAILGSVYGSINTQFKTAGTECTTVPAGIAHFLEHKLFENENGEDACELFAKNGAYANAFTSYEKTCYTFSCASKFATNLDILLNFVTSPCFNEAGIKKEQGIIIQELKMYEDSPDWQAFMNTIKAMYSKHPLNTDIIGTQESILKITKEFLNICYNTYYVPCNMILVVIGDVNPENIVSAVDKLFEAKSFGQERPETIFPQEPSEVIQKVIKKELPVLLPMANIGFKEASNTEAVNFLNRFKYNVLLDMLFGSTSEFFKACYDQSILDEPPELQVLTGNGFVSSFVGAVTREPERFYQMAIAEIARKKRDGLNICDFKRLKKSSLVKCVRLWEDSYSATDMLFDLTRFGLDFNDIYKLNAEMDFDSIEKMLAKSFNEPQSVLSIVNGTAIGDAT
jgi:predicted Zn-dependent peptidase